MNKQLLKARFQQVVRAYIDLFCQKHEVDFEYWVGDRIGEICEISDAFLSFDDIRHDIDKNIPKGEIFKWHWERVDYFEEWGENGDGFPNFETFVKRKKK